jgi:hypothetical protein
MEPAGVSFDRLETNIDGTYDHYVKFTRDMNICQKCPKFQVKHVKYGCKRHYEPLREGLAGITPVYRKGGIPYPFNATEEEMKLPENQPFFCEEYDEYSCLADGGGGYKKDWFERVHVTKKCVFYAEQYVSAMSKDKNDEDKS